MIKCCPKYNAIQAERRERTSETEREKDKWSDRKKQRENDGRIRRQMKFDGSLPICLSGMGGCCLSGCVCVLHTVHFECLRANWAELSCKLEGCDCSQCCETHLSFNCIISGSLSARSEKQWGTMRGLIPLCPYTVYMKERKREEERGDISGRGTEGQREQGSEGAGHAVKNSEGMKGALWLRMEGCDGETSLLWVTSIAIPPSPGPSLPLN